MRVGRFMKTHKWAALGAICLGAASSCHDEPAQTPTLKVCGECHGTTDGNAAPPADVSGNSATTFRGVGAHRSHTDASTWHATVACDECHAVPTLLLDAGHMDTVLPAELTFGALASADGATPAWDGAVCSGSYCHGRTLSAGTNIAPTWTIVGGSEAVCGACHGTPPSSSHVPSDQCGECHAAVADNGQNIVGPNLHIDGTVTYEISASACTLCHSPTGGSHTKHVAGLSYPCTTCHDGYASSASHRNGTGEATGLVNFDANNPSGTYNEGASSCGNLYCHSNGVTKEQGGAYDSADIGSPPNGTPSYSTPTWGGSVACGDCHAGAPLNTITGSSDYPPSGEHQRNNHVNSNVGGYTYVQCFWCHATSSADALQGTYGSSQHADGVLDFHPYSTLNGGTMWPNSNRTYEDSHCGDAAGCWY